MSTWIKRIGLFVLTNIAVMAIITIIASVFGITGESGNLLKLAITSLVFGMVGSVVSLFMSKGSAKKGFKIVPIKTPKTAHEKLIYSTVQKIAQSEGIKMPEVGIYHSPAPNAFATGATKNSSLVAVSSGLLDLMDQDEIEGVVGHEMAHILNGDMVTMTLLQGIMNSFVYFAAQIVTSLFFSNEERGFGSLGVSIGLQLTLGFLAGMIVSAFSRHREFRADAGSAKYLGRNKMIKALQKLESIKGSGPLVKNKKFATMGIFGSMGSLRATHPPLEKRIEALKAFNV